MECSLRRPSNWRAGPHAQSVAWNWMPGWSSITPPLTASTRTNSILDYARLMETFGSITSGQMKVRDDENLPFTQTSLALETSPVFFADVTPKPFDAKAMITLQRTLESLFENMTPSARYGVLPAQDLRGDTALLTRVQVNATSTFARNVDKYDARGLVVAYSLAVVGSAACILLAVLAVRDMRAVYSNNFSTVVRATSGQRCLDQVNNSLLMRGIGVVRNPCRNASPMRISGLARRGARSRWRRIIVVGVPAGRGREATRGIGSGGGRGRDRRGEAEPGRRCRERDGCQVAGQLDLGGFLRPDGCHATAWGI